MYNINDTVLYGKQGVCKIKEIKIENFSGKPMEYYFLQPAYSDNTVIYVPVDNDELVSKMRKVISVEEIDELIKEVKESEVLWYDTDKERREKYNAVIASGDRKKLLQLIHSLYINQEERKSIGKNMYVSDERIMKEAEKLVYEEFATVLKIKPNEVTPYIVSRMKNF